MNNPCLKSLLLMFVISLVGCGASGNIPPAAIQSDSDTWSVELSMSGGIAGMQRQLTVDDSGEWRTDDRRLGQKHGQLSAKQLSGLSETLAKLESTPDSSNMRTFPGRCADCIETRIIAVVKGKHFAATSYSGSRVAQPYKDLFRQLSPLLKTAYSKQ